jgi:hypothetical protein
MQDVTPRDREVAGSLAFRHLLLCHGALTRRV